MQHVFDGQESKPFLNAHIGRTQSDTVATTAQQAARKHPQLPPLEMQAMQKKLTEKLEQMKSTISEEEVQANDIIRRMRELRSELHDTLGSCHRTMETTSHCLEDYFRHIPPSKLFQHISMRFQHFDKDHSGTLDRDEVTEAMAEMGQRPTEKELDEFFALFDKNNDRQINLAEFDKMVRVKLKLIPPTSLKPVKEEPEETPAKEGNTSKGWAKAAGPPKRTRSAAVPGAHPIASTDRIG